MNDQKIREIEGRYKAWIVIMLAFGALLVCWLFGMQILDYDEYQQKVIDSIQSYKVVPADRGEIYDRNMVVLATDTKVYRIFIDPSQLKEEPIKKKVCEGLSEILDVDYKVIYERASKENRADETVKKNVEEADANLVRAFIEENGFQRKIYLEATSSRYYPYGSLAANVIGAMGTDGGMFGLEMKYNTYLKGTNGRYITTKNAQGQSMPSEYSSYVEPKDGYNLVTTIDITLQSMLEKNIKDAWENANAQNRVTGILMDPNDGSILAMATYPNFDLNTPYVLDADSQKLLEKSGFEEGSKEYNEYFWELVYKMWNNKAVTELYEPGSTMKVITTAMALEENVVKFTDMFTCTGSHTVAQTKISCHKRSGHETHSFDYMLQQSCNPTMMQVAAKIGNKTFYDYFISFGYTARTGIDLPGEERGIYTKLSGFNAVELACYSFGQTFKTTPIQQLSAIASVANGGYLVTPHVVKAFTDSNGNIVEELDYPVSRQVVSSGVCALLRNVLEDGVSGDGGARNAYVAGYKIAAKTGTSEKRDKVNPETGERDLRIASCVAMAPADKPIVVSILIVDEPKTNTVFGSALAAPYTASLMADVLPYLGVDRQYSDKEMSRVVMTVDQYTGMKVSDAQKAIEGESVKCVVVGKGDTVLKQVPQKGEKITKINGSKIIIYTEESGFADPMTVPSVVGKSASVAITTLQAAGFNVYIEGATNFSEGAGATVIAQLPDNKTLLENGDVVTIVCRYLNMTD